jgi:TetR/AcrR family transcriptional repressor of nem operon
MNAKTEQKVRTHDAILESAARLLREKGIGNTRVADLMDGAGLTVGGFYAHFPSKTALVDDVIRLTGKAERARLFERLEEKPEADRAEVVLKRYLSVAHRDNVADGCPMPAVVGEIGTTASEHGSAFSEQLESLATQLQSVLPGDRAKAEERQETLALIALMYGSLALSRAVRESPLSEQLLKAGRAAGRKLIRGDSNE